MARPVDEVVFVRREVKFIMRVFLVDDVGFHTSIFKLSRSVLPLCTGNTPISGNFRLITTFPEHFSRLGDVTIANLHTCVFRWLHVNFSDFFNTWWFLTFLSIFNVLKFWWINYKFQICKLWFKSAKTQFFSFTQHFMTTFLQHFYTSFLMIFSPFLRCSFFSLFLTF